MAVISTPIVLDRVTTIVDPVNSSTVPLGANATFTGAFQNLLPFPEVDVTILTDQPGTLYLDVSADGVTVAQTTTFAVTTSLLFRSPFSWPYLRLRYVNGSVAQTTFFLQFLLRPTESGLPALPLNRNVSDNSTAPLSRAVLMGKAPSGFYQNLGCNASNVLLTDGSTVTQPATLGNSVGKSTVNKTGSLTTIATTVDQVVLTYTVTAGKTFYLQYFNFGHRLTALPGNNNPILIGTIALETPSGTKLYTKDCVHPNYDVPCPELAEPLPIAAGTVIRVVCTPAATSSTLWRANFGGYEK
jgi:hypothetical protein